MCYSRVMRPAFLAGLVAVVSVIGACGKSDPPEVRTSVWACVLCGATDLEQAPCGACGEPMEPVANAALDGRGTLD